MTGEGKDGARDAPLARLTPPVLDQILPRSRGIGVAATAPTTTSCPLRLRGLLSQMHPPTSAHSQPFCFMFHIVVRMVKLLNLLMSPFSRAQPHGRLPSRKSRSALVLYRAQMFDCLCPHSCSRKK